MNIIEFFAVLVCTIGSIGFIRDTVIIDLISKKIQKVYKLDYILKEKNKRVNMAVIIPVLREQKIIESTLEYFKTLNDKNINFRVVVVTTEKEQHEGHEFCSKSTAEIIEEFVSLDNNKDFIHHVHYPYIEGKRAHQINYALRQLPKLFHSDDIMVGFYDADSRPDPSVLQQVLKISAKKQQVHYFQQISLFFKDWNEYGAFRKNNIFKALWLTGAAANQTNFSLKFEFRNLSREDKRKNNYYAIAGHGFFARYVPLIQTGGFPEDVWCEDMALGIILTSQSETVELIPSFEIAESPNTIAMYVRQTAGWFTTASDFNSVCELYNISKAKYIRRLLKNRAYMNLLWLMSPLLLLFYLVSSLIIHEYVFIFVLSVWLVNRWIVSKGIKKALNMCPVVSQNEKPKIFWIYLSLLFFSFVSNIGPITSVIQKMNTKLTGKIYTHKKTERL